MSIYYIKQDNTVWCCEEDSGPYNQEIDISFVKCECPQVEPETMAEHLQGHQGGGQVLKWRKANENERSAWYGGKDEVFDDGIAFERERIIKLLEEHLDGGLMFAEDWNTPGKEIAYTLFKGDIIALIKGENK